MISESEMLFFCLFVLRGVKCKHAVFSMVTLIVTSLKLADVKLWTKLNEQFISTTHGNGLNPPFLMKCWVTYCHHVSSLLSLFSLFFVVGTVVICYVAVETLHSPSYSSFTAIDC